jgi:hypothetical protein
VVKSADVLHVPIFAAINCIVQPCSGIDDAGPEDTSIDISPSL